MKTRSKIWRLIIAISGTLLIGLCVVAIVGVFSLVAWGLISLAMLLHIGNVLPGILLFAMIGILVLGLIGYAIQLIVHMYRYGFRYVWREFWNGWE